MDTPDHTPAGDAAPRPPASDPAMDIDWGDNFGSDAAPGSKGVKAFGVGPASDGDDLNRSGRGGTDTFERGPE